MSIITQGYLDLSGLLVTQGYATAPIQPVRTIALLISPSGVAVFSVSTSTRLFKIMTSGPQQLKVGYPMAIQTNLNCPQGEDRIFTASYDPVTAISGNNYSFYITDAAGNLLLTLTSLSGAIVITDNINGVATITLTKAQTALLPVMQGQWSMWRTDSGFSDKVGYGLFTIFPGPPS